MNKRAILHIPQSQYAFPRTEKIMTIRLRTASDDLTSCTLYYGDRACCETPVSFYPLPMAVAAKDELFDYYEVTFDSPFNRLCYYFKIEKEEEWTYYYGDQLSKELPDILLNGTIIEGRSEYYQYPFILRGEIPDVPEWFKKAVVYNIFPDSFANGNQTLITQEKQILTDTGLPSKAKLGGTMKGITESLSYIKNLGFTCIYLNPIFMAGEYHKYDILDYYRIDPCFGNEEDFRELVEKVHENHMHIIIDGVFNHCGWYFFAFEDVVKNGESSKYRDWFYDLKFPVIRPVQGETPTYACFAYEGKMPKLNTSNKVVAQYFADVCRYWIRRFGIDGWRLDVANEIDRDFWRVFRKAAKDENKDIVLIGEVWENADAWLRGDIFDSTMNYDFRKHCRDFFALGKIDAFTFGAHISQMLLRYPYNITLGQLNLLDTHDVSRFLSLCSGDIKRWKLAFITLMLLPGVPSLLYGDEKKITGLKEADYRSPMPWQSEEEELEKFIRFIISLRKKYIGITSEYQVIPVQKGSYLYSFYRTDNRTKLLVIMNAGDTTEGFKLPSSSQLLTGEGFRLREPDLAEIQTMGYGICLL
jgi:glycosidase